MRKRSTRSRLQVSITQREGSKAARQSRSGAGKIHGDLPDRIPDNWSEGQPEEVRDELKASIDRRIEESQDFGGPDASHMARIRQEQQLLRQIEDKLGNN